MIRRMQYFISLLPVILMIAAAGCWDEKKDEQTVRIPGLDDAGSWTIMVFMNGDNNLEPAAIEDLNEMEGASGLDAAGIRVLVLVDRAPGYDTSNGNWTGTRLYRIVYDTNGVDATIISERLASAELGLSASGDADELDMGDYENISRFVSFAKKNYPADNYAFIIWNHGDGWRAALPSEEDDDSDQDEFKAVSFDDSSATCLYTQDVRLGLQGRGMAVIGFDACYEGMIEVAYEIRNEAAAMIGSEETEPGDGWEYDAWLSSFKSSARTPRALATAIVDAYKVRYAATASATLSGIDLSKIDNVMARLNSLSSALYSQITTDAIRDEVVFAIDVLAEDFFYTCGYDYNVDIWDMAEKIKLNAPSVSVDGEADALKAAIDDAVICEWHNDGHPDAHGMAIHLCGTDADCNTIMYYAYMKNYTPPVSHPLLFVNYPGNTWVRDWSNDTGLLYRLLLETLP